MFHSRSFCLTLLYFIDSADRTLKRGMDIVLHCSREVLLVNVETWITISVEKNNNVFVCWKTIIVCQSVLFPVRSGREHIYGYCLFFGRPVIAQQMGDIKFG